MVCDRCHSGCVCGCTALCLSLETTKLVFLESTELRYGSVKMFLTHISFSLRSSDETLLSMWFLAVPQEERVATPALLTWKVTQKKMPWSIILLLGGGFALAKGSE
ncbi:hypothetical protein DNTS_027887, partial [Danionella cerebrum]